jgi:putative flippase GtrA
VNVEDTSSTPEAAVPARRVDLGELARFGVVGLSAVGTDFLVYMALVRFLPTSLAKCTSFAAGATLSFVLNRLFVFKAKQKNALSKQVGAFVLLYAVTLVLNALVNAAGLALGLPKPLAWLFATGASTVANFLGMKLLVFADARRKQGAPSKES